MSSNTADVRDFLVTRRGRITPQQAGLTFYGGNRRVPGLRREEVAMLAGVSADYYTRLEKGNLSGVSDTVLEPRSFPIPVGNQTTSRQGSLDTFGRTSSFVASQTIITGEYT